MKGLENKLKGIWNNIKQKALPYALTGLVSAGLYGCELLNKKQDMGNISVYAQNEESTAQSANKLSALADYSSTNYSEDCEKLFEKIEVSDGKTWTTILDEAQHVRLTEQQKSQIGLKKSIPAGQYHAIKITLGNDIYVHTIYHTPDQGNPIPAEVTIEKNVSGLPNSVIYPGNLTGNATNVITLSSADKTLDPFDVTSEYDIYLYFNIRNKFNYTYDTTTNIGSVNSWEELNFDMWTSRMAP